MKIGSIQVHKNVSQYKKRIDKPTFETYHVKCIANQNI